MSSETLASVEAVLRREFPAEAGHIIVAYWRANVSQVTGFGFGRIEDGKPSSSENCSPFRAADMRLFRKCSASAAVTNDRVNGLLPTAQRTWYGLFRPSR
ncbi:hypothetical protein [Streptomyces sp. B6B3]|uniref:hypothetical protein n=1 Tax=Streptomyces sp. B6B3 TaxID=3153570 RepID=UPI00325C9143